MCNIEITQIRDLLNLSLQRRVAQKNGSEFGFCETNHGIDLRKGFGCEVDCLLEDILHRSRWAFRIQQWWRVDGFSLPFQEEMRGLVIKASENKSYLLCCLMGFLNSQYCFWFIFVITLFQVQHINKVLYVAIKKKDWLSQ